MNYNVSESKVSNTFSNVVQYRDGNFYNLIGEFIPTMSGSVASASYALFAELASSASFYQEKDPIFNAASSSFILASLFNSFTGSFNTGSFTGSFTGTLNGISLLSVSSSFAATASYVVQSISASYYGGSVISSSYANTASYIITAQTASYVLLAQTASYYGGSVTSASYAGTASTADTFFVRNNSFNTGSVNISGSINMTGSLFMTGSLNIGTSQQGALTASITTSGSDVAVLVINPSSSYRGVVFDFVLISGSYGMRAGTMIGNWSGSQVASASTLVPGLGTALNYTMSISQSSGIVYVAVRAGGTQLNIRSSYHLL